MLRFFRRQRPVHESEFQELRDNFELSTPITHGVPQNVHRLAVDSQLGLVAVITKQGYLELYTRDGNKRVLLKKLGSPCSFFDFVEGEQLLLVICVANPSSGLPEGYHLIDTNGVNPCLTTCRPSYLPNAKCFTRTRFPEYDKTCILTGNSNGSIFVSKLSKNDYQLEFVELASVPKLLPDISSNKFSDFTCIQASKRFIFCCFQNSFIVVLCSKTRRLFKTVDIPFKFTTCTLNEDLQLALFVSTEMQCSISLVDLSVSLTKVIASSFDRTSFYQVVISARTNKPIVLYSSGIPDCTIRRTSSLTLNCGKETRVFSLASELRDIRVVYESKDKNKRKATAIILLCEHEVIAIDLLDEQYRCVPLNFLQCVDSSAVTAIRLENVDNDNFSQQTSDSQYSERKGLFGLNEKQESKGPKSLIFTGHQNGDIFIWDLSNGSQHLLQVCKTTNYLRSSVDECIDEPLEEVTINEDLDFKCDQTDYEILSSSDNDSNHIDWLMPPAKMWSESKSKKIIETGLYDDRCEDDRLAIESFCYCNQLNLLACGLNGGYVLVLSTSDETNSTSQITSDELKFVNARLTENDQATTQHDPIKIQNSSLWEKSLFKPKPNILCVLPSTPIRALNISDTTGMIAIGCSTGIVVFDATSGRVVYSKNFLNQHAAQTVLAGEKPLNRLKTMKQTIRKSFRGKSLRMSRVGNQRAIERQVEFRDTKQPACSGIRCVRFHENIDERSFLFAGTSNAVIYMFEFESNDSCYLCKEIRLSHTAPIIDINFIRLDNQTKMFVFTEEQIRSFVVENLRSARFSYKLTAKCGIRIKQANVVTSLNGSPYNYLNMICNDGSLLGTSATDQRIRTTKQITKADDAVGIRLSAVGTQGEVALIGQSGSILTYFATKTH